MNSFSTDFLDEMRRTGDPLADETVARLFAEPDKATVAQVMRAVGEARPALDTLPDYAAAYVEAISALQPDTDHALMRRGHRFFQRHAQEVLSMLGFLSLPYCYAAADGAQVLYASKRILEDTRKRLAETGQFVWNVMQPDAFEPHGTGYGSVRQVRLIHATIRYHLRRSERWDEAWGLPVNQEDMGGTNLAFSFLPLRGLRKMNVRVDRADAEAYLYAWNRIGLLLGGRAELLPLTLPNALRLDRLIAQRHFRPSEAGQALTAALITCLGEVAPTDVARSAVAGYLRFLLGDPIADMLAVPQASGGLFVQPLRALNVLKALTGGYAKPQRGYLNGLRRQLRAEAGAQPFRLPRPSGA